MNHVLSAWERVLTRFLYPAPEFIPGRPRATNRANGLVPSNETCASIVDDEGFGQAEQVPLVEGDPRESPGLVQARALVQRCQAVDVDAIDTPKRPRAHAMSPPLQRCIGQTKLTPHRSSKPSGHQTAALHLPVACLQSTARSLLAPRAPTSAHRRSWSVQADPLAGPIAFCPGRRILSADIEKRLAPPSWPLVGIQPEARPGRQSRPRHRGQHERRWELVR